MSVKWDIEGGEGQNYNSASFQPHNLTILNSYNLTYGKPSYLTLTMQSCSLTPTPKYHGGYSWWNLIIIQSNGNNPVIS